MRKEKKTSLRTLLQNSFLYSLLDRFAAFFYRKAENGVFGGMLTGYDRGEGRMRSGLFAWLAGRFNASKQIKHTVARGCEQSRILGFFDTLFRTLGALPVRFYGGILLPFGGLSALSASYKAFRMDFAELPLLSFVISGAMVLCGLVMLCSGKNLYRTLRENRLASFLLFSVMGVRRSSFEKDETCGRLWIAVLIGVLLGVVSHFIPALLILLAFFGVLALYAVLVIPEFGVVASLFGLCFLPTMVLVAMMAYTFLCYMLKLWRGKRTFRFSMIDGAVIVFFLFMAGGGLSSVGGGASLQPALVYLCFMLGYFLMVNLIRSEAWIRRSVIAVVSSSALVSLYGVYQNFFGVQDTTWQDTDMFSEISGRVVSTFENPNVLGEYLVMILPLLLALMILGKGASGKFPYFLLFGLSCACLVFTWSRGAWLGIMLTLVIFFLVYTRKTMILCCCGVFAIPFLPFILPDSILSRFTSIGNLADSSTSYRVSIWEAAVKIAADYPISGIGIGNGAFSKVYPLYSLAGIEAAPHAHNLFLQTAIEVGIPGLFVLVAVIFLFAQGSFTFWKKCKNGRMKRGKLLSLALFAGLMGVLLQGMTDYIWYNYRVYLMFWLVLGLAEAIRRVSLEVEGKDLLADKFRCEVKS